MLPNLLTKITLLVSCTSSSRSVASVDPLEAFVALRLIPRQARRSVVGIDVRTKHKWLGHESLATTQKYLEPSKDTEKQLEEMKLPF